MKYPPLQIMETDHGRVCDHEIPEPDEQPAQRPRGLRDLDERVADDHLEKPHERLREPIVEGLRDEAGLVARL